MYIYLHTNWVRNGRPEYNFLFQNKHALQVIIIIEAQVHIYGRKIIVQTSNGAQRSLDSHTSSSNGVDSWSRPKKVSKLVICSLNSNSFVELVCRPQSIIGGVGGSINCSYTVGWLFESMVVSTHCFLAGGVFDECGKFSLALLPRIRVAASS